MKSQLQEIKRLGKNKHVETKHLKCKHNLKSTGHSKSSSKREVHRYKPTSRNKQKNIEGNSNFTPKRNRKLVEAQI